MQYPSTLISALALLPAVNCIAFGGPAPTQGTRAVTGSSPKPTNGPSLAELRRRANVNPETCGFYSEDLDLPVTCGIGRTCMMFSSASIGAVGCCDGSDLQACGWATGCVDYQSLTAGNCNGACKSNSFIRKCTDSFSPYCVTWTYPGDGVKDFGCTDDILSTYETIFFDATDTLFSSSTSISLPTISGKAVTGWDGSSTNGGGASGTGTATETDTDTSNPTSAPSNGGGGRKKTSKSKVSIGLIVGVAAGVFLLFLAIVAIIIFCCVKQKKKKKQELANQQAMAAAQASRPQSQYNPPMQHQQMAQMPPPMPQTPQPANNEYFKPGMQHPPQSPYQQQAEPQKFNYQQNVHETQTHSPSISNPPTPTPAYTQPYHVPNGVVPPMPAQSPGPYQPREPTPGAHEVDAISMPHAPTPQGQQPQHQPVYEIGSGR
ncbi:uncharacterized protein BDR25DRAFT_364743 [Lindgomyces ingoldianus]|uniref:Uncharacterized protein n=1 Tax=Lindgomyces ingoldianus TaxID=673940 RepID=A0ACB6RGY7_9PLEO|nr:uncharacterized protein BDR25DRAFT_364743 [Lindgomyces ingoldianus]KAF2477777.1 hypothetical protein BDR25DRAFT_364743 [Lindgomyces ingoldianus]